MVPIDPTHTFCHALETCQKRVWKVPYRSKEEIINQHSGLLKTFFASLDVQFVEVSYVAKAVCHAAASGEAGAAVQPKRMTRCGFAWGLRGHAYPFSSGAEWLPSFEKVGLGQDLNS